jgi:hypothetical protein
MVVLILQVVRAIDTQPGDTTVLPMGAGVYFDVIEEKQMAYDANGDLVAVIQFMTGDEVPFKADSLMIVARPISFGPPTDIEQEVDSEEAADGGEPDGTEEG